MITGIATGAKRGSEATERGKGVGPRYIAREIFEDLCIKKTLFLRIKCHYSG